MADHSSNIQMARQPANPTSEEQLRSEVKRTYARLAIAENECIEVVKNIAQMSIAAVISLHQTLLNEHHDFFIITQHPAATPILKNLAGKYHMPARMWRYGIQSCLELLLAMPFVQDHILGFIYFSYSMVTVLLEEIPSFKGIWIECLGDLARYRMAVEDTDNTVREIWAEVSRSWYNHDIDQCSEPGRIQHHLAVLSRPDSLRQFFYYSKALISVTPFANARKSMIQLFNPILGIPADRHTLTTSFVAAHGILFMHMPSEQFVARSEFFLMNLRQGVSRLGPEAQRGIFITCCNIAAILQYGEENGAFAAAFAHDQSTSAADAYVIAKQWASAAAPIDSCQHFYTDISSQFAFRASSLAFHTLIVILGQADELHMHPTVHVSMAFLWCLTLHPLAIQRLEPLVPWSMLANYLNTLFQPEVNIASIEDESFPSFDGTPTQQLPEDFLIKGHIWSRLYYPANFFDEAAVEVDRPLMEEPSTMLPRKHRCLWLGVRLSSFSRWMTYDRTRQFMPTRLAHHFAPDSQIPEHLMGIHYSATRPVAQEMGEV